MGSTRVVRPAPVVGGAYAIYGGFKLSIRYSVILSERGEMSSQRGAEGVELGGRVCDTHHFPPCPAVVLPWGVIARAQPSDRG